MRTLVVYVVLTIFQETVLGGFQPRDVIEITFEEYNGQKIACTQYYRIRDFIEKGTFGNVFKASFMKKNSNGKDLEDTLEMFAVKIAIILLKPLYEKPDFLRVIYDLKSARTGKKVLWPYNNDRKHFFPRFENEYSASLKIHGNGRREIGVYYAYGAGIVHKVENTAVDGIALVMDFIEGVQLFVFSKTAKSANTKLMIGVLFMTQILATLEILQDNQMVHRDLKPQNVLVMHTEKSIQFVLIDFDAAKFQGSRFPEFNGGTLAYGCINQVLRASGKHFIGDPDVSHSRSCDDVQSAIFTFYNITTGKYAWDDKEQFWDDKQRLIDGFLKDLKTAYGEGSRLCIALSNMFLEATDNEKRDQPFVYSGHLKAFQRILNPDLPEANAVS